MFDAAKQSCLIHNLIAWIHKPAQFGLVAHGCTFQVANRRASPSHIATSRRIAPTSISTFTACSSRQSHATMAPVRHVFWSVRLLWGGMHGNSALMSPPHSSICTRAQGAILIARITSRIAMSPSPNPHQLPYTRRETRASV